MGKKYLLTEDEIVDIVESMLLEKRKRKFKWIGMEVWDGDIDISGLGLKSLEELNLPRIVKGSFYCNNNYLDSLKGAPEEVGWKFDCSKNGLKTLEGAPRKVGGNFDCYMNSLKSLKGAPKEVGGNFDCSYNQLTSLEGSPKEVGGSFACIHNFLTSLKGAPEKVGGNFYIYYNDKEFTEEEVREVCDVKGKVIVSE